MSHRPSFVCRRVAPALAFLQSCIVFGAVDFNRDVRPILSDNCFVCHGPDKGNRKSALRLDTEAGANGDLGNHRFAVVPVNPQASELLKRITSEKPALRMPPAYAGHDRLKQRDIDMIERWI